MAISRATLRRVFCAAHLAWLRALQQACVLHERWLNTHATIVNVSLDVHAVDGLHSKEQILERVLKELAAQSHAPNDRTLFQRSFSRVVFVLGQFKMMRKYFSSLTLTCRTPWVWKRHSVRRIDSEIRRGAFVGRGFAAVCTSHKLQNDLMVESSAPKLPTTDRTVKPSRSLLNKGC